MRAPRGLSLAYVSRADDPAARYFSRVTARARTGRAAGRTQSAARSGGRWRGLGIALVLALIPVAAAIGVTAGRSSNNGDSKLIQALARRQPTVTVNGVNGAGTAGTATAAAAGASTGNSSHHKVAHVKVSSPRATAAKAKSSTGGGSGNSTTANGSVHRITGSKPTKSEEQQGAAATQKVQKSTGKNYVNSQQSLPSQVVVP